MCVLTNTNAGDCSGHSVLGCTKATGESRRRLIGVIASVGSAKVFLEDSLRGSSALDRRFLAIALVESIYAARCIYQLLFAGEERVTSRADFHVQVGFACRARLKRLATRAGYGYFSVFGVNSRFHYFLPCSLHSGPRPCFQTGYDRGVCVMSSRSASLIRYWCTLKVGGAAPILY